MTRVKLQCMQDRKTLQSGGGRTISDGQGGEGDSAEDATFAKRLQRNRSGIWLAIMLTIAAALAVLLTRAPG